MTCLQVAQSYGLFLGTIVMNPQTAQTIAAVIMIIFMLTGGYFTRGDSTSPYCFHLFMNYLSSMQPVVVLQQGLCETVLLFSASSSGSAPSRPP